MSSTQSLEDYIIRSRSYWQRTPDVQARFSDPNAADFARHVDVEAVLYLKELQDSGVPFPRWLDMLNVGGETDLRKFLEIGRGCYDIVRRLMDLSGSKKRVLDWGVGCGRTARHFYRDSAQVDLYGCDPDSSSIDYLDKEVDFIRAALSYNNPPLVYADNFFDYIYGISILTHLNEASFRSWMAELTRVLKPGGQALLTVHGTWALNKIQDPGRLAALNVNEAAFRRELPQFDATGFLWTPQTVISGDVDPTQYGITFVDEGKLHGLLPANLKIANYLQAEVGGWQDMAIFEKA